MSMMDTPVIVVSGLGRCGSSLVMQMLHAGGMACIGDAPDFEDSVNTGGHVDDQWLAMQAGRAVKILDPHRVGGGSPKTHRLVIWLDRDVDEQAKSHSKFLHHMAGMPLFNREQRRLCANSLKRDRARALVQFKGQPILLMPFEMLIGKPLEAAGLIVDHLRVDQLRFRHPLDIAAMAAVVVPRTIECMPDLSIEESLVRKAETA